MCLRVWTKWITKVSFVFWQLVAINWMIYTTMNTKKARKVKCTIHAVPTSAYICFACMAWFVAVSFFTFDPRAGRTKNFWAMRVTRYIVVAFISMELFNFVYFFVFMRAWPLHGSDAWFLFTHSITPFSLSHSLTLASHFCLMLFVVSFLFVLRLNVRISEGDGVHGVECALCWAVLLTIQKLIV